MDKKSFGKQLKDLRVKAGYSVRGFAKAAGVAPHTIELHEKEELASPRYATAKKLATALNVTVDELMSGTDAA